MVRELTIEILGIDWYIEDKELLDKSNYAVEQFYYAGLKEYKGQIAFIHQCYDTKIPNEILNDERFLEVCTFIYLEDEKEKERFQGTFIDALKYIQKVFKW